MKKAKNFNFKTRILLVATYHSLQKVIHFLNSICQPTFYLYKRRSKLKIEKKAFLHIAEKWQFSYKCENEYFWSLFQKGTVTPQSLLSDPKRYHLSQLYFSNIFFIKNTFADGIFYCYTSVSKK